jgi:hypothetical protein
MIDLVVEIMKLWAAMFIAVVINISVVAAVIVAFTAICWLFGKVGRLIGASE